jgi:hypothetical protein
MWTNTVIKVSNLEQHAFITAFTVLQKPVENQETTLKVSPTRFFRVCKYKSVLFRGSLIGALTFYS